VLAMQAEEVQLRAQEKQDEQTAGHAEQEGSES